MTPAARLQAAIEILQELEHTALPADRFIRDWFRRRRYAGSKDRAAVAERVFDVLRHRSSFAWRMQSDTPRALVIASLLHEGQSPEAISAAFSGEGYGPPPLSDDEAVAIDSPPQGEPPPYVRGEYPPWLEPEFRRAFATHPVIPGERASARPGTHQDNSTVGPGLRDAGVSLGRDDRLVAEMRALQSRAPIDLRVNTLKANRDDVLRQLLAEGYDATLTRHSPFGIRIPAGASGLEKTALFASGAFELQDEASQIAALLVDARPDMRVLDLAAGAGGKLLALAAQMRNQGEIVASDVDARRLAQIPERARRAGVTIIQAPSPPLGERAGVRGIPEAREQTSEIRTAASTARPIAEFGGSHSEHPLTLTLSPSGGEGKEWFERVLIDAPCSGTGTWRRQPELRWRLTPERLEALKETQSQLLDDGARHVKPGGRLIYATCSLLPSENEDQIGAFLAHHSGFAIRPACEVWIDSIRSEPPPGTERFFRATPRTTGTDGFFAAMLQRAT